MEKKSQQHVKAGRIGGKAPVGAFSVVKGLAREAGIKGARIGKRGRKYLEEKDGYRYYRNLSTGKIEKYEIS